MPQKYGVHEKIREEIRRRAFRIYKQRLREGIVGDSKSDFFTAEKEINDKSKFDTYKG